MSIAETRLEIRYRRIDDLKPDPRNPRQHTRKQIRQLARSIETFGFTVPALVDREDNVLAGHGRIMACRELGWSEIPTIAARWSERSQACRPDDQRPSARREPRAETPGP